MLGSNNNVVVTIADLDTSAPYNLSAPETVQEGQGSFAVVVETADTPIVEYQHSVTVAARSDTAQPGSEYVAFSTVLEFDVDHNRRTFEVTLIDDGVDEPDKSFRIKMVTLVGDQDRAPYGITEVTVTILDDDPATPTNLEIIENRTDPDLDHVAVLQWDYSDAEGYLLESRDGTSGNWNCIVAGTYSSREPTGTSTVSTTRGGAMAASQDWHFRVRNFTSQEFSYPGEATCDEDENEDGKPDYGYIFSTVVDQGYNLSPADTLGPVCHTRNRPHRSAYLATHRPHHRRRSQAPRCPDLVGRATGWQQRHWLRPLPEMERSRRCTPPVPLLVHQAQRVHHQLPGHARRRLRRGRQQEQVRLQGVPTQRCRPTEPVSPRRLRRLPARRYAAAQASVTATLTLSTDIFPNSDGDLEYASPPAPAGLTLETRFRGRPSDNSTIIARWEDVENAPGYKVRWRETNETDWREQGRSRKLEANANACSDGTILSTLNDGRVWCFRENSKLLTTSVTPWPWMFNSGPGKLNDNIAPARKGFGFLESGVRHEVQVATCTDQSCDNTGAWSSSRYAYAR